VVNGDDRFAGAAMEATIRIAAVALIAAICFVIVRPFIALIAWATIIAVAVYPGFQRLVRATRGRDTLAAVLMVVVGLFFIALPALMLSGTVADGVHYVSGAVREGELKIPLPPDSIAGWPVVGSTLHEFWGLAAENLSAAVKEVAPYLKDASTWLLSAATGAGVGLLEFIGSILVAGVLLVHADTGHRTAVAVFTRLAGERGAEYAELARSTVRSVATGIVGVALIQALLAGIGLLAAGIPGAGLWALMCLLLCVIQLGPGLVLVPAVIYVFYTGEPVTAVIFLIWSIFVTLIDNVLKPLLLGRGVKVPIVVIFLGAIGGFLAMGILGLFVGSVVLVLGFRLFSAWLEANEPSAGAKPGN